MLKSINLDEPYSNFQQNCENGPKNISTYFIKKFNNQLEEEYSPEIFSEFREFNEYRINNYSEKNLNNEPNIFYTINKTNDETEKMNLNIENNNKTRLELMSPLNSFDKSNKDFSLSDDYYNSENTISNINKFIDNNFPFINDKSEKEKESILIGKKRRLFNITYPKSLFIFNKGGNDNYIRQLIKESFQNNKEYFFSKRAKKGKEKKKRKDGKDNIRKKIKVRFLKTLKIRVNELLSLAGSEKKFKYLQQEFITNVNKDINRDILDLTFKEIYSKDFCKDKIRDNSSEQKYKDNQSVLKYLEEQKEISEKSKYDIFKNMKYYQIFEEYLKSEEFEKDIYKLKEKYNNEYIINYIRLAFELNDFFIINFH